jgi:hypothetical protein
MGHPPTVWLAYSTHPSNLFLYFRLDSSYTQVNWAIVACSYPTHKHNSSQHETKAMISQSFPSQGYPVGFFLWERGSRTSGWISIMAEIGGPEQPECPTNRSVVKGEEKLPFMHKRFVFTSVPHVVYESGVEDHNQQVSQTERWISLKRVHLTQPLLP